MCGISDMVSAAKKRVGSILFRMSDQDQVVSFRARNSSSLKEWAKAFSKEGFSSEWYHEGDRHGLEFSNKLTGSGRRVIRVFLVKDHEEDTTTSSKEKETSQSTEASDCQGQAQVPRP